MLAFFNQKDDAQAAADAYATRTMHAALGSGLADMNELGIREAFKVKQQVVLSASEAAEMILRVDDIVQCAPRQRQQ